MDYDVYTQSIKAYVTGMPWELPRSSLGMYMCLYAKARILTDGREDIA